MRALMRLIVVAVGVAASFSAQAEVRYRVVDLGPPSSPSAFPFPTYMDNSGRILGVESNIAATGFLWQADTGFRTLAPPPGFFQTLPGGISPAGTIVGYSSASG